MTKKSDLVQAQQQATDEGTFQTSCGKIQAFKHLEKILIELRQFNQVAVMWWRGQSQYAEIFAMDLNVLALEYLQAEYGTQWDGNSIKISGPVEQRVSLASRRKKWHET